jgi:hypothetical protein
MGLPFQASQLLTIDVASHYRLNEFEKMLMPSESASDNSQENWRLGVTLALPVDRRNSIKLYGDMGVYSRTGSNFNSVGFVWQYRWGRGL